MSLEISVTLGVGFKIADDFEDGAEGVERLCEEIGAVYSTVGSSWTGEISYIVGPAYEDDTEGFERYAYWGGNLSVGSGVSFEKLAALGPELERIRLALEARGYKDLRALVLPTAFLF